MRPKSDLKRWNTWRWAAIYFVVGGVSTAMVDQMRFDWNISPHYLQLTLSGGLGGGAGATLFAAAWCIVHNRAVARQFSN
ncbi:MAG TPA: hypothetical protein VMD53_12550 [Rhizomicrobium sp.]|nr:hypothetical protein [Rhizomicrobium sp.]